MATKPPNSQTQKSSVSEPKARLGLRPKSADLREFLPLSLVRYRTTHRTGQPGPILRERQASWLPPGAVREPAGAALGTPLSIREVADLIGCSPWSVRQTLIPRGLPHFRFTANGRLIFYRDQVIRWIKNQQQGGKTTK
jgi:hypothetical protein